MTVTVNGVDGPVAPNNRPTLTISQSNLKITEDDILTADGKATGMDTDADDTLTYHVQNGQGQYGELTIDANTGEYIYTADNDKIQFLNQKEKTSENFIVKVTDSHGETAEKNITVDITGLDKDMHLQDIGDAAEYGYDTAVTNTSQYPYNTTALYVKKGETIKITSHEANPIFAHIGTTDYVGRYTYRADHTVGKYGNFSVNRETGEYEYNLVQSRAQNAPKFFTEDFKITVTDVNGIKNEIKITATVNVFREITLLKYGELSGEGDNNIKTEENIKLFEGTNIFTADKDGILYIGNKSYTKEADVSIIGGEAIPYFKLGVHQDSDLQKMLNANPNARAVQFESDRTLLTVTSELARDYTKNPSEMLQLRDKVIATQDEISGMLTGDDAGVAGTFKGLTHGIQAPYFPGAYMWANSYRTGYPSISGQDILDSDIAKNSWGPWHESGHQRQLHLMDFVVNGEVTVNIYSHYTDLHIDPSQSHTEHFRDTTPSIAKANGRLKENDGDQLAMYLQLFWAFGKEFYQQLHQEYRLLSTATREKLSEWWEPDTLENKQDLFHLLASKVAGYDLTPFFDEWKFTVNNTAKADIQALNLKSLNSLPKNIWDINVVGRNGALLPLPAPLVNLDYVVPKATPLHESIINIGSNPRPEDLINYNTGLIKSVSFFDPLETDKADYTTARILIEDYQGNKNIIPVKVYITPNGLDPNDSSSFPADLISNWTQYSQADKKDYIELAKMSVTSDAHQLLSLISDTHLKDVLALDASHFIDGANNTSTTRDDLPSILLSKNALDKLENYAFIDNVGAVQIKILKNGSYLSEALFENGQWQTYYGGRYRDYDNDYYAIYDKNALSPTDKITFTIRYTNIASDDEEIIEFGPNGVISEKINSGEKILPSHDVFPPSPYNPIEIDDNDTGGINTQNQDDLSVLSLPSGQDDKATSLTLKPISDTSSEDQITNDQSKIANEAPEENSHSLLSPSENGGNIYQLTQKANNHQEIHFDPNKDIFDLGNIQADLLNFHEENGSTILELPSLDQTYILKDISLDELEITDFITTNNDVSTMLESLFHHPTV